jgi:hypothetical protein
LAGGREEIALGGRVEDLVGDAHDESAVVKDMKKRNRG